ncbi:MAG: FAD-binding oxidoreductase [Paracoccus sp. (in: a-proteobacteria)]|nr:FAD-binding oxidoreductase [Paracoccus sp. (in: a-proteobacteria)]
MTPSAAQLDEFRAVIGAGHVLTAPDDLAPYLREDRGRWRGAAGAVLRPADTDEAARLVAICAAGRIPLVPQGGNTGLVGGGMAEGGVVISTGRMSRIRALDALNATITVEAGATLLSVQEAARGAGLLFPLSLASEGSCQIGGNLATNAGGTAVLRYGTMRDLTLGIEAVMPDGRVMDLLGGLRKDNTGYALRDLLIGSEGTLGLITAATLRLFPAPAQRATAFIAAPGPHEALALFDLMRNRCGESLSAFEYLERFGLQIVLDHLPGARDPLAEPSPSYVLAELTSPDPESDLSARFEAALAEAFERGLITDAAIGASEAQGAALWQLREAMSEMQKHVGASIKHDVAVPVSRVADFITEAVSACRAHMPGLRPCPFGHFGDGNIHFNLTRPEVMEDAEFLDHYPAFNRIVHDIVASMGGSISAEHGIGQAKRGELLRYKDPVALDLFRAVKAAIDPQGIMNPGKLIPPA